MKPITLRGHEKPINVVKLNFDGDFLFTGSGDKKVNLWDAYNGERIGSFHSKAAIRVLDVTDDSEWLVVGTLLGTTEFFKINGGQHCGLIEIPARLKTVEFSYGDQQLLVLAEWYSGEKKDTTEFLIYDFNKIEGHLRENSKKPSKKYKEDEQMTYSDLIVKPDNVIKINGGKNFCQIAWGYLNKTIIAVREDGELEIYNLKGEKLRSSRGFESATAKSFSIVKDFSLMIVNSNVGSKIFDPETLECLKTFKTDVPMNAGCISPLIYEQRPSEQKFHIIIGGGVPAREAAGTKSGGFEIRLHNIIYEEELGLIQGHFGPVNSLCFHKDGRGFCSGGEEGYARIFRFDKKYFSQFE